LLLADTEVAGADAVELAEILLGSSAVDLDGGAAGMPLYEGEAREAIPEGPKKIQMQ
jgi:hypothetical protein